MQKAKQKSPIKKKIVRISSTEEQPADPSSQGRNVDAQVNISFAG